MTERPNMPNRELGPARWPWVVLGLILTSLLSAAGSAQIDEQSIPEAIAEGLNLYAEAQDTTERDARIAAFARAERLFFEAAEQSWSGKGNAALYANAGTAALQAERLGPAVLSFRRALLIDPGNRTARHNLAHARGLLPGWVPRPTEGDLLDTFFFWHRSLPAAQRVGAGAVCFLLAGLALGASLAWRSRLARGMSGLFGLAWLGLTASVVVQATDGHDRAAVLVADETVARASDSFNAPVRFAQALPGGTEVTVLEARQRWARVRLANDREAWVSGASLAMVSHPPTWENAPSVRAR